MVELAVTGSVLVSIARPSSSSNYEVAGATVAIVRP
jgi:hypothetical protein